MKLPRFSLLLSSVFFIFAHGCQKPKCEGYTEDCGCPPSAKDLNPLVELVDISMHGTFGKSFSQTRKIEENDTLKRDERLVLSLWASRKNISFFSKPTFTFFPSAYACSYQTVYHSNHKINGISITSNRDFDQDHRAGEDLIDLFYDSLDLNKPIEEVANENVSKYLFDGLMEFVLRQKPKLNNPHKFTITLLIDEETFVVETPNLFFEF